MVEEVGTLSHNGGEIGSITLKGEGTSTIYNTKSSKGSKAREKLHKWWR